MNTNLAIANQADDEEWGIANPRRGLNHHEAAAAFIKEFPVGQTLSATAFDEWAHRYRLLNMPPVGTAKRSDQWMAHLHRRHELRYRLNKAGSHPRMLEASTPFSIDTVVNGTYEVRSPQTAVVYSQVQRKLQSLVQTKRQQVAYLMQSADWENIKPSERALMEELFFDISAFEKGINLQADLLSERFARVEAKLRRAIQIGEVKPQNGGLKQLLSPAETETEGESEGEGD